MNFTSVSVKKLSGLLHIIAWTILFILPIYMIMHDIKADSFLIAKFYIRTIIYALIFYLNFFWLIPQFLFKSKNLQYYLSVAILITGLYFINERANHFFFEKQDKKFGKEMYEKLPKPPRNFDIYNFIFTSILISGFSIGLRMSGKFLENEKQRKELEKEKLTSELAFLKNQISPHFFFNTLNNIYSLVEINKDDAQKSILKLSKLMRYLLYESEKGNTMLSHEIVFMNNYIDLMHLRLSTGVDVKVNFPSDFKDFPIPPLLFIPFIENAFKHGISYRQPSFIDISMNINDNEILFICKNGIFSNNKVKTEGIGLENVKKRLNLLFPENHDLKIKQTDKTYEINLLINFPKQII